MIGEEIGIWEVVVVAGGTVCGGEKILLQKVRDGSMLLCCVDG
jgi:hypothetical protein